MVAATFTVKADFSGTPYGGTPTWTDISAYVLTTGEGSPISITFGRQDESSDVSPSTCSFTLIDDDGRFTPTATPPIAVAASTGASTTSGTGLTLTLPAAPSAGDVLVACFNLSQFGASRDLSAATGWTTLDSVLNTDNRIVTVWGVVGSGALAAATSYTFSFTGSAQTHSAALVRVTGGGGTIAAHTAANSASTSLTAPNSGDLPLAFFVQNNGTSNGNTTNSVITSGWATDQNVAPTFHATVVGHGPLTTASASVAPTASWGGTVQSPMSALVVVRTAAAAQMFPGVRVRVSDVVSGTTYDRFDGYIDSAEVHVSGSSSALVAVSATDILARMGTDQPLRAIVIEEMLLDQPASLYPLDEAAGSTSAGDIASNGLPAVVKAGKYGAGTLTFGAETTVVGIAGAVAMSSPNSGSFTSHARASYLRVPNKLSSTAWTVEMWVQTPSAVPAAPEYLWWLPAVSGINGAYPNVSVFITFSGLIRADMNSGSFQLDHTAAVCDGAWHHVAVSYTKAATDTLAVTVDGVTQTATATTIGWTNPGSSIYVGASVDSSGVTYPLSGAVALMAQYSTTVSGARLAAHYQAGATAFAGESTDTHATRLLTYRPDTGSSLDAGDGMVGAHDTIGVTLQQALLDTGKAEGGVLYVDGTGRVVLKKRTRIYNSTSALTLSAAASQVAVDTTFRIDTQGLVNDMTASRPDGGGQRVTDATSQALYGIRAASDTYIVNTDRAAANIAGWTVAVHKMPKPTSPNVTVDLKTEPSTTVAANALSAAPLTRLSLTNLPATAPSTSMDLIVEGWTETISVDEWLLQFFTAPVPPATLRIDAAASAYTKLDSGNLIPR